jgi:hypothetical protein
MFREALRKRAGIRLLFADAVGLTVVRTDEPGTPVPLVRCSKVGSRGNLPLKRVPIETVRELVIRKVSLTGSLFETRNMRSFGGSMTDHRNNDFFEIPSAGRFIPSRERPNPRGMLRQNNCRQASSCSQRPEARHRWTSCD